MLKKIGQRLKDQRGLTLIELLAVVVILGIIAAIAVPSIGNIIAKSKYDAAKADALQVLNAAKLYSASYEVDGNTSLDEDNEKFKEFINEVENLVSYTVEFENGTPSIDATAKEGITAKGQTSPAKFEGTISEVNSYDYSDKNE
ncbi:type IV pilin protein [Cytobacillus dafuensis]|uniref:Prepilin-type N-terminal cleavage/methylation domain-containing protein n=1 Tax=Cytobacillus dafuensis TaxID=1742359 RepID=A0A5B8Z755_CYTDA|nr:prepilin-type N-terminal cleavage/methylation domain-containing protein [Cytobacillus dafuensis]QED48798.1 prepilin-type N-terminal cleavage/methylation domain-containing protein [Cytobacillus dafuensis]